MFERPDLGERAVLVHIKFSSHHGNPDDEQDCDEFIELVASTGVEQVGLVSGSRQSPDPRYFVGSGKVDEIHTTVRAVDAEIVIFDHELSPSQERNLEKALSCRVLDRTGLILDIFAQRARSHEGKLQVELAQLQHLSTRLVRGWTHLERQKGGIGLRGPGEKQLETDRRLLNERIRGIQRRLDKVRRQRDQGRQSRKKAEIPTVSLVGYTNAGKSTLFNALSGAGVYAADQLFATLDPTLRRIELPNQQTVVLADTVGFIRQLPHDLVAAFRATLQETEEADLLLHVIDASDPKRLEYIEQVERVLSEIDAGDLPQIQVFNKIDLTEHQPQIQSALDGLPTRVWVSAQAGTGLDLVTQVIQDFFAESTVEGIVALPASAGRLRAELYACGAVKEEEVAQNGNLALSICMSSRRFNQLSHQYPELEENLHPPGISAL